MQACGLPGSSSLNHGGPACLTLISVSLTFAALRAAAGDAEFAEAEAGLVSACGYPLTGAGPLAPLARDLARSLTEAGSTLHHCAAHDPLYRLGGVFPGRSARVAGALR